METAIELSGIRHKFVQKGFQKPGKENEVLKGIDLKIYSGEIFGLLGPSGAGKTTLIKIMTGRIIPAAGQALLFPNMDTQSHTRRLPDMGGESSVSDRNRRLAQRKQIGMMMDDFGLYERLSCTDNLAVFADLYGVSSKRVEEILKRVNLWEARKRPVADLSKGMRTRLSLARAVLAEPALLFLDEPTTGLDPGTAAEIHDLIRGEKKRGATIFLTTHNMEEAAKLCDHVALLNEGKIVEYGEPEEICRRYNHHHKIRIRFYNGECEEIGGDSSSADRIADYFRQGMVETIHSTEPDLETVFMELTGRGLGG